MALLSAAFALALAGCAAGQEAAGPSECAPAPAGWREAATEDDRRRLRRWRAAWTEALAAARAAGHADEIDAAGSLLEPDAALPDPMPPAGDYDCRTIKLGARSAGLLDYVAYPAFRCRLSVADGRAGLVKLDGSQRPAGRLYADERRRMIFLGTLQLGDESRAYRYGRDRERDLAGILERVGERRWRLAFPYPHFESLLDVIELTPAAEGSR